MFCSVAAASRVSMLKWVMSSSPSSGRPVLEVLDAAAILQTQRIHRLFAAKQTFSLTQIPN